ncbi:MAG: hypothetical protein U0452_07025 [Anaerolineae bacterium]
MITPPGLSFNFSAPTRRRLAWWAGIAILLFGSGLRFAALVRDARFHPDEALFATFARTAAVQGDWLLHGNLDKPPLAIYASALGMTLFGVTADSAGVLHLDVYVGEFAARLPSALAGIAWVAMMMACAHRIYRRNIFTLWVGLFAACSPMAILFSASAFTDGWLLLWLTAALWAASGARWVWSGLCLAFAFETKQQGLLYLPLVLSVGWVLNGFSWRSLIGLLAPTGVGIALVFAWDSLRTGSPSLFGLATANNWPARPVSVESLGTRTAEGLSYARGLLGPATAFFSLMIATFAIRSLFRRPRTRAMNADLVFVLFILIYATFHIVSGLNLYDRYGLPLLPPLILLAVRASVWAYTLLSRLIMRAEMQLVAVVVALVLLAAGIDAAGGHPGYSGGVGDSFAQQPAVDEAADWLADQHIGAVVYDRWLGWQLGYYLGTWSDKRLTYFPDPETLTEAALILDEREPRYLPVPNTADAAPWLDHLSKAGFEVEVAAEVRGITIYALTLPG